MMAAFGAAILASYWLPRFVSGREPAASALLILAGFLASLALPEGAGAFDPVASAAIWERVAELCVIVGLFGAGLRIDRLAPRRRWGPTLRLLTIAMPATILGVALAGWSIGGLTLAGGLLLGAVLAPTDPVLAGDVQVGRPNEGGEHPVRFTLSTEAGLNDGLAFRFVHLAVAVAAAGGLGFTLAGEWLLRDVLYRAPAGAAAGLVVGWLLGRLLFDWPADNALSRTQSGVIAFAGVLMAYGVAELLEGYGFIAAFIAGLTLRRVESEHAFHRRLHDFSESLEHALTALLLLALGAALPSLWPHFDWRHAAIGMGLIFFIRPVFAWMSLGGALKGGARMLTAFYGVRGIGSIDYLAYAGHHTELVNEYHLWGIVAFTILLSTLVHGLTAGVAFERFCGPARRSQP